jgi:hypothetical protein
VAQLAAEVLQRTDSDGRPLSPERIEQLMEEWLPNAGFGWMVPGSGGRLSPGKPWTRVAQESLEARRPTELVIEETPDGRKPVTRTPTLEDAARRLLANGGVSPWPQKKYVGDDRLTARHEADWNRVRRVLFPRAEDDENGVEK